MKLIRRFAKSELVRGSGIYLIASVISASTPFLLLPILTRYLSPVEYGEVAIFTVLVSFLSAVCGLCVNGAANRKYFDFVDEPKKLAQYIFTCILILILSSLVVFVVIVVLSPLLSGLLKLPIKWILLAVPVAVFGFLVQLRLGQWQVDKRSLKYGTFQISQSITNGLLSVLFVVGLYLGATGRILGVAISTILFAVIAVSSLLKDGLINICWKPDMAKDALRFGTPLVPHILGLFLISSVDRIVIANELGLEQAGIYMVAIQISMAVNLVLTAVNQTFVPWLFERLKSGSFQSKITIVKVTYAYYMLLALGSIFGFWIGDDVLRLIVGLEYVDAAELIGWVILAQAFHGGYLMVTNYFFYANRTGLLSSITISTGIFNLLILFVFIKQFGLIGAVWAFCISKLIQWLATWYIANKAIKMPWLIRVAQ